jgi:DNA-binding winged helix-turn-helix (wHTH) protein
MEQSIRPTGVIRFGVFEVDLRAEELRKSGLKLRLRGQAFQVLAMLLESPGEVVTREELQQRLWPEGTFVDFDHGLNTAINKIREVLGDSAENPRFVETLARRGYRFIAPVDQAGRTGPQAAISDLREEGKASRRQRKLIGLPGPLALFVLILVGAVWLYFHRPASKAAVLPPMKLSRFTSYPGKERDPAFSPDGKQIAFAWDGENRDNFDIYVQSIGGEKALRLTTDPRNDLSPVWSPDGRYIAFARVSEGNCGFYLVASLGGHERKLADVYSTEYRVGKPLDWSPDGKFLAVTAQKSAEEHPGLFSLSVESGQ